MEKKLFSIIVPVYCGGQFAEGLINNIKQQGLTKDEYELIFVDDASPDNTTAIIQESIASHPEIDITLIKHSVNKRQGGAKYRGKSRQR